VKINTSRTNDLMALPVCTIDQAASIVAAYYAALAKAGKKFSTIQNYGWSARALIARHGGPCLVGNIFLKGFLRCLHRLTGHDVKKKKAVSQKFLLHIKAGLNLDREDHMNIWVAVLVAFMTLLRSSEYTMKPGQRAGMDREAPLRKEELELLRPPGGGKATGLRVHINRSKTDQIERGTTTLLAWAGGPLCAVEAVDRLQTLWPKGPQEPAFSHFTGGRRDGPLRYGTITAVLKKTATRLGLKAQDFSSHSLRAGGASALARGGALPWQIQAIGRWKSDAYLSYIRSDSFGEWTTRAAQMLTTTVVDELVFEVETVFDAKPDAVTAATMDGIYLDAVPAPTIE